MRRVWDEGEGRKCARKRKGRRKKPCFFTDFSNFLFGDCGDLLKNIEDRRTKARMGINHSFRPGGRKEEKRERGTNE